MTPATIALIMSLVEEAITQAPALVADLQALFAKGAPTAADFDALRASITAETYGQFVPASSLPAAETGK